MADLIYRGSPPVGPVETQGLFASEFAAIWSPPMYRHAQASEGDRVWLVWREEGETGVTQLGWGVVMFTPEKNASWTNASAPGIVEAARSRGYGGPTNMAFLRLQGVHIASSRPAVAGLVQVPVGLSVATEEQTAALASAWDDATTGRLSKGKDGEGEAS